MLIHTPSDGMERFAAYCQPLMASLDDDDHHLHHHAPQATSEMWKQQMIELHSQQATPKKRSRAPRGGGIKRKRVEEELVWEVERMCQEDKPCYNPRHFVVAEDDAHALEYLHRNHNGNVSTAEWSVMVNISAGRGECETQVGSLRGEIGEIDSRWSLRRRRFNVPNVPFFDVCTHGKKPQHQNCASAYRGKLSRRK